MHVFAARVRRRGEALAREWRGGGYVIRSGDALSGSRVGLACRRLLPPSPLAVACRVTASEPGSNVSWKLPGARSFGFGRSRCCKVGALETFARAGHMSAESSLGTVLGWHGRGGPIGRFVAEELRESLNRYCYWATLPTPPHGTVIRSTWCLRRRLVGDVTFACGGVEPPTWCLRGGLESSRMSRGRHACTHPRGEGP
jgi:hypothetical protein